MKSTLRTRLILLAAVAAAPVAALPAAAQYQSSQQGDALDANRRVGDDYRNTTGSGYRVDTRIRAIDPRPSGNQIVTGNVTGNRGFHDRVGYRDAREFTGPSGSRRSDNFIRESVGVVEGGRRMTDYNVSVPFYSAGRTIQPPPGYVQPNATGGGYVPGTAIDARVDRGAMVSQRTGSQLILPGPLDATTGASSLITASPLLGIQRTPYDPYGQPYAGVGVGVGLLDDATVQRMRTELRPGLGSPQDGAQPGQTQQQQPGATEGQGGPINAQPLGAAGQQGQPGGASGAVPPAPGDVTAQPLGGATVGGARAQSTRQRLLPSAAEQTPAYAELRKKLDQLAKDPNLTDEQAFRAAQRARQEAAEAAKKAAAAPAIPQAPAQPGAPTTPGQPPAQPQPPTGADPANPPQPQSDSDRLGLTDFTKRNEALLSDAAKLAQPGLAQPPRVSKPAPVKIESLATGVPGKGLADLLTGAESLMKEGKFSSALEKYNQAEQVAPNNPLIKLGRANAELGASYFARAEQHLREAFTADDALLMGQYDLRAFLGEDRLKVIANDLKEIATTEKSQARPVFLLAYIAYNSGNEAMAERYLDLAEERAGGNDPLIEKIRRHWTFPAADEQAVPAEPESAPGATAPAPAPQDVEVSK